MSSQPLVEAHTLHPGHIFTWQDRMYVVQSRIKGESDLKVVQIASRVPGVEHWVGRVTVGLEEDFNGYAMVRQVLLSSPD